MSETQQKKDPMDDFDSLDNSLPCVIVQGFWAGDVFCVQCGNRLSFDGGYTHRRLECCGYAYEQRTDLWLSKAGA